MDAIVRDALLGLLNDAHKGVERAREALSALSALPPKPEALIGWAKEYAPNLGDLASSRLFGEQIEEWYRSIGFVPRDRYLELLDRYEQLRLQLEETEEAAEQVKSVLDPSHAAAKLVDTLGQAAESALRTQTNWLKSFRESVEPPASASNEATHEKS
jgi:hypothetical protein